MTGDRTGPGGLFRIAVALVVVTVAVGPAIGAAGVVGAAGGDGGVTQGSTIGVVGDTADGVGPGDDQPPSATATTRSVDRNGAGTTPAAPSASVDGGSAVGVARQVTDSGGEGLLLDAVELSTPRAETVGSNEETASVVEISFDDPVILANETRPLRESDVRVFVNGNNVSDEYSLDDDGSGGGGTRYAGQVVLSADEPLDTYDDLVVELPRMESLNGERTTGPGPVRVRPAVTTNTVVETSGDGDPDSAELSMHVGRTLAVVADDGEGDVDNPIDIEAGDTYLDSNTTGRASQVWLFNSSDWTDYDGYEFDLTADPGRDHDDNQMSLRYRDLGLSASVESLSVDPGETIRGEVVAKDVGRQFEVVVEPPFGRNTTQVVTIPFGSSAADFRLEDTATEGDYTIWVRDTLTDRVIKLPTVRVSTGSATLPSGTIRDQRGDVVSIPVRLRGTDSALVSLGDDDVGYQAVVEVEDGDNDGQVTLEWNTYLAGRNGTSGAAFGVDDSGSYLPDTYSVRRVQTDVAGGDAATPEIIDATNYDVDVYGGGNTAGAPDDVGTVNLTDPSLTSIRTFVAPAREKGTFEDADDVEEARRNGNLTASGAIARDDLLVFQVDASGFEGAVAAAETPSDFLPLDESVRLRIEEIPDLNEDPLVVTLSKGISTIPDGDADRYYVLVDTSAVEVTRPSRETDEAGIQAVPTDPPEELALEDGDRFNVSLTVEGERTDLYDEDPTVRTAVTFHERAFEVPSPYRVAGGTRVTTLPVGTTLAPGTIVEARIRGESNPQAAFLRLRTTTVESDQVARFELAGNLFPIGKRFTMRLTANGTESVKIDGRAAERASAVVSRPPPDPESNGGSDAEPAPASVPPSNESVLETTPPPTSTPEPPASASESSGSNENGDGNGNGDGDGSGTASGSATGTGDGGGTADAGNGTGTEPAGNATGAAGGDGSPTAGDDAGTDDADAGASTTVTTTAGTGGGSESGAGPSQSAGGGLGLFGVLVGILAALGPVVVVALVLARQNAGSGPTDASRNDTDGSRTPTTVNPGPPDRSAVDLRGDGDGRHDEDRH
jgi:hypothetical protein